MAQRSRSRSQPSRDLGSLRGSGAARWLWAVVVGLGSAMVSPGDVRAEPERNAPAEQPSPPADHSPAPDKEAPKQEAPKKEAPKKEAPKKEAPKARSKPRRLEPCREREVAKRRPDEKRKKARPSKGKPAPKKATQAAPQKATKAQPKPRRRGPFRGCPKDMVPIRKQFCIDRYEAYVVEMRPGGGSKRHSPFEPVAGKKVKARNRRGRMPQAYISRNEAEQACHNAGKRLCSDAEWLLACKGNRPTTYPYGKTWKPGRCNDSGFSSFNHLFGGDGHEAPQSSYTWDNLNDPRLNRQKQTCAPAGKFKGCRNSFRVYDMVGNLHEWTARPSGTFRGGYYLDVHQNGKGCDYRTTAHGPRYHDYSTGFRCCK